jgi:hypothetical protein
MEKKSIKLFKIASEVRNKAGRYPAFKNYESVNVSSKVPKGKEEEAKSTYQGNPPPKVQFRAKRTIFGQNRKRMANVR